MHVKIGFASSLCIYLIKNNDNGKNIISFLNSRINTNYKIENDVIIFNSVNSRIKNNVTRYIRVKVLGDGDDKTKAQ